MAPEEQHASTFLRRWAMHEMQEEALEALWRSRDVALAEEQMVRAKRQRPLSEMSLPQCAGVGAALTAAIVENRRDLARAHRSLGARGVRVTLNELQRFYYAHFRRSAEGMQLCR